MPDLKQSLRDFIATSNSGKYKSEDELLSKFPELKSYDKQSLRDFVATSNSGKYKTEDELLSKFPEFGIVKKKESTSKGTGLLSKQEDIVSSLVTKAKKEQKPSGSSASEKPRQDIFTGYPGKEDKKYKLDTSTGKPVWNEYSETVFKNNKQVEKYDKPITDPARVSALNKQFNKNAGVSDVEEVFIGYPGKETNKYRVYNGNWERMQPGKTSWTTLTDAGSINSLNNQYNKKVKPPTVLQNTVQDNAPKFTDINSKLVSKTEENVVPYLQNKYGDLGFSFEQTGMGTDYVKVTAKNGNTMEVGLDESNPEEALKLRTFLDLNKSDESPKNNDIKYNIKNIKDKHGNKGSKYNAELEDYYKSDKYLKSIKNLDFYDAQSHVKSRLSDLSLIHI